MKKKTPNPKSKKNKQPISKKGFKNIIFLAYIPVLAGLIFASFLVYKAVKKPRICFIDIPENLEKTITDQASDYLKVYKKEFNFITLESQNYTKKLQKKLKTYDLVFTSTGAFSENLSQIASAPNLNSLSLMPTAMRKAAYVEHKAYSTPVLFDHFELAWNKKLLLQTDVTKPLEISDILTAKLPSSNIKTYNLVCAGAENKTLFGLISALTEAIQGVDAYNQIIAKAKTSTPQELITFEPLQNTLQTLIEWRNTDVLHPEWFRMTFTDLKSFMENDYAIFVAMFLSDHRKIEHKIVQKFDSIYFPSIEGRSNRSFIAPAFVFIQPYKRKPNPLIQEFAKTLTTNRVQEKLSSSTGLSPSNAQCETPDIQSSEARLWIASSQGPLPSFSASLYANPTELEMLAKLVREYISTGGKN